MAAPAVLIAVEAKALKRWSEALQRELPDAQVFTREATKTVVDATAKTADYAVLWRPHASLFAEQRRLKAIFNLGAGIDALAAMPEFPRAVPLIRLEDAGMAGPMAHYVLAAVLRFMLGLGRYAQDQREHRWAPKRPRAPGDVRIGVMGLGAIGRRIAHTLIDQGFNVRGYVRHARAVDGLTVFDTLAPFLDGLDVLVNALPLTAETSGILRREHLVRLADGAHLINLARGAHLVDEDLLELLDSGKLSGATLDVFREEPLPPDHPFWTHDAITVTPHVAGVTLVDESVRQVADKIRALESGAAVSGVVDWKRGY
jgi:glyoxylate/hydroxypyruvate reductase